MSPEAAPAGPFVFAGRSALALWTCLTAAVLVRFGLAWFDDGIVWPDEVFQSLEPAHRTVFGTGLLAWEFEEGARSWIFPGTLALVWQLLASFGVDDAVPLVRAARLLMAALGLTALLLAAKLAEGHARGAGTLLLAQAAFLGPLVVFDHRALSEVFTAPFVTLAALVVFEPGKPRESTTRRFGWLYLGGVACGIAAAVRIQNALFVPFLLGGLVARERSAIRPFMLGLAFACGFSGVVDLLTYGEAFHSTVRYLAFNLAGARAFGTATALDLAAWIGRTAGPGIGWVALGFVLGVPRMLPVALAAVGFVLAHAVTPHKELRFLVPMWPLALAVSAVGLLRLGAFLSTRVHPAAAKSLPFVTLACLAWPLASLRYGDLGLYIGSPLEGRVIWRDASVPRLMTTAGRTKGACGVALVGAGLFRSGGYTYLHANLPLYLATNGGAFAQAANLAIVRRSSETSGLMAAGFEARAHDGDFTLYSRGGPCEPGAASAVTALPDPRVAPGSPRPSSPNEPRP